MILVYNHMYCGVRWCVRVRRRSLRAGCLGGLSSVVSSPRLRLHVPGPRSVIFWTCLSRARPFPWNAPRLPLLLSILQRCFRSTAGAAIFCLPSRPDVRGTPSIHPGPSRLSISLLSLSLSDTSLAETPRLTSNFRFNAPEAWLRHQESLNLALT